MSLLVATVASTSAADLQILSISANGRLTWTNAYPNGLYDVEWAPRTSGPWSANWTALQSMVATGTTAAADVPMLYRVKCTTNLFMPLPIGGWNTMSVSNAAGNVWTQKVSVVGTVYFPSKSNEFRIVEMLNPINPPNAPILAIRSTESAIYVIDNDCGAQELGFTNAPLGVGWTDTSCGNITIATNEAIESVTVPAGTFTCIRVRKQRLNTSHPNPVWIEWWLPGFGQVKWIDYYVEPSEYPPVLYQLTGHGVAPH
jgi:hypothetical protein